MNKPETVKNPPTVRFTTNALLVNAAKDGARLACVALTAGDTA
jgi:hypothetical protein